MLHIPKVLDPQINFQDSRFGFSHFLLSHFQEAEATLENVKIPVSNVLY